LPGPPFTRSPDSAQRLTGAGQRRRQAGLCAGLSLLCLAAWGCDAEDAESATGDAQWPDRPWVDAAVPVVTSPVQAQSITVGMNHACALTTTGRTLCWGSQADLGRLDHAPRRAVQISANRRSTGAVFADGTWMQLPTAELSSHFATHTQSTYGYSPALGVGMGTAESGPILAQAFHFGADGGCLWRREGQLLCIGPGILSNGPPGQPDPPEPRPPSRVHARLPEEANATRWSSVAAHSSWVGCGQAVEGEHYCWPLALAISRSGSSADWSDDLASVLGTGIISRWQSENFPMRLPADTLMTAVGPAFFCYASGSTTAEVRCHDVVLKESDRTDMPTHRSFADSSEVVMTVSNPRHLAAGSRVDRGLVPRPDPRTSMVCAVDADGRTWCSRARNGAVRWLDGLDAVQVETNGETVCGRSSDGKVRCEALPGATTIALAAVPTGLAEANGVQ
jgi:hypothetical protein